MCYNETECFECTQGYFLNEIQECESKFKNIYYLDYTTIPQDGCILSDNVETIYN